MSKQDKSHLVLKDKSQHNTRLVLKTIIFETARTTVRLIILQKTVLLIIFHFLFHKVKLNYHIQYVSDSVDRDQTIREMKVETGSDTC